MQLSNKVDRGEAAKEMYKWKSHYSNVVGL